MNSFKMVAYQNQAPSVPEDSSTQQRDQGDLAAVLHKQAYVQTHILV